MKRNNGRIDYLLKMARIEKIFVFVAVTGFSLMFFSAFFAEVVSLFYSAKLDRLHYAFFWLIGFGIGVAVGMRWILTFAISLIANYDKTKKALEAERAAYINVVKKHIFELLDGE